MQIASRRTNVEKAPRRPPGIWLKRMMVGMLLLSGLLISPAWSADTDKLFEDNPDEPWQITADTISYDDPSRRYVADGNVRISKGAVRLTADHVRFDHRTMDAAAKGHVVLVSGKDVLIGESVEINLQDQIGKVINGTIFLEENHFYIRGAKIEKLGPATYAAERASLSSCDGETPAWKITGRKLDVTLEGYGVVRHAALYAREVPVFYTPFFVFPASTQRQTGLLAPEFGSSNRKGTFFQQPFYWAINESSDLTYAPQFLSKRGFQQYLEYRYVMDAQSRGTAMASYLRDREVDDGLGDNSDDWGYTGDNFLRPNQDRYWFRMKHDQGLPFGFKGRIDLDIASDQDYLTEFRSGLTGFNETRQYFRDTFGRDLDDFEDPIRTNQAIVSRRWETSSLNGGIVWLDDTSKRWTPALEAISALPKLDTQLQRLPLVRFDAMRQPLGDTPLLFNMDTEWTYFYSDDNTNSARVDLHPRVTWPVRLGQALYVEPSAGLRQTAWFVRDFQNIAREEAKDKTTYRTLYDLKLDVSTEFSKVYGKATAGSQALRHTVLPRVVYEYIPSKDQDEYPAFIGQDGDGVLTPLDDNVNRIDPVNKITYSIVNSFTDKRLKPEEDEAEADQPPAARYNDVLRLKLEQSYDIREARGSDRIDPERKRPFSPIRAELEYFPTRYFALRADAEFDVYDHRLVSRNVSARLSTMRGDEFQLEYRFDESGFRFNRKDASFRDVESLYGSLQLKLPFRFTAYATNEYDFETSSRIETTLGLIYEAQCWSLDVQYKDEQDDEEISFRFNLYGLGPLGTK
ncbi:MAG: LPS assembly protein LptD [Desulfobacterales bacterium]|jgi:LPS-assembly protein